MARFRLVATDVNDTLLDSVGGVSPRTRAALDAARDAGLIVVPVTARRPVDLHRIAAAAGLDDWALCGNGAYGVHLGTGEPLFAKQIRVDVLHRLATALDWLAPGVRFASVQQAGARVAAEPEYAALATGGPDEVSSPPAARDEVLSEPSLKLTIRHPSMGPYAVLDAVQRTGLDGFTATVSGTSFVSVAASGVSKATGLAALCERLGVAQHEVLAFGNARNDVSMLHWAGHGVAVANAVTEARGAADEIAPSNDDDGVAIVIERMLAD